MKALAICWIAIAAMISLWPHPASFKQRWPNLPASISLDAYNAARRAAERPAFCVYEFQIHWHGKPCRIANNKEQNQFPA
jgi:hypothetical protein